MEKMSTLSVGFSHSLAALRVARARTTSAHAPHASLARTLPHAELRVQRSAVIARPKERTRILARTMARQASSRRSQAHTSARWLPSGRKFKGATTCSAPRAALEQESALLALLHFYANKVRPIIERRTGAGRRAHKCTSSGRREGCLLGQLVGARSRRANKWQFCSVSAHTTDSLVSSAASESGGRQMQQIIRI